MGKKGSWLSALKRAFTSNSKDKTTDGYEKKRKKEKKTWGLGKSRTGEVNSFIPLHRQPSSIEKILGDAESEQQHRTLPAKKEVLPRKELLPPKKEVPPKQELRSPKREVPPKKELFPKKEVPPKKELHPPKKEARPKKVQQLKAPTSTPTVTLNYAQTSAVKIQAAYRGYMARKSYRALKGLMRLQGVMRGQSIKRQTINAMRCMQLLVRVQSQIRTRRLQMMESRNNQHHQTTGRSDKEIDSSLGKWSLTPQSEAEAYEEWDDSVLTKDEIDTRMRRKVEAVIKRERALAYAYSHQLLKVTPKSAHAILSDVRSGGYPWWWTWLERQLHPPATPRPNPATPRPNPTTPRPNPTTPAAPATPNRRSTTPIDAARLRPSSRSSQPPNALTPRAKTKKASIPSSRWSVRDDESLTSCPAYTVPNYMTPTVSAKAKVREGQAVLAAAGIGEGRRRFSFGLSQSRSLRWGGSKARDSCAQSVTAPRVNHRTAHSIGDLSVDSARSLPAGFVGRKAFK